MSRVVPSDERVPVRQRRGASSTRSSSSTVDERIRELTAAGMTREAAASEVARRFGSPLRLREQSRDVKLLPWLDSIVRDVRLGVADAAEERAWSPAPPCCRCRWPSARAWRRSRWSTR